MDSIEQIATKLATWLLAAIAGGVGGLVRRMLINEQQIAFLEVDLKRRDDQRAEGCEAMRQVKESMGEIKPTLLPRP